MNLRALFQFVIFIFITGNALSQPGVSYQWAKKVGSGGADYANQMSIDDNGNIYLTGVFALTADFDPGTQTSNMVSTGYQDLFFARYDSEGNYIWAKKIHASGSWEIGNSIQADDNGNVFLTGTFQDTADFDPGPGTSTLISAGHSRDFFFAKYDSLGNFLWVHKLGSGNVESGSFLDIDVNGNLILSGFFFSTIDFNPAAATANLSSNGDYDIFVAKYDNNGNYVWANSFGAGSPDRVYALETDNAANIYITGGIMGTVDFDPGPSMAYINAPANSSNIFFAKWTTNGSYVLAKSVTGSTSTTYGQGIAVDAARNIYVTGRFWQSGDFDPGTGTAQIAAQGNYDAFVAKYDNDGNYRWAKSLASTSSEEGKSIDVDDNGNVYITGSFAGPIDFDPDTTEVILTPESDNSIFFGKYDSLGNYVWAKGFGRTNLLGMTILSVDDAIYLQGNFFDTADFNHDPKEAANLISSGGSDFFFAKYLQVNDECSSLNAAVTQSDNTLTAEEAESYQWINCSNMQAIPNETGQSFTSGISGSFALVVSQNSCADTSSCFEIIITGIETSLINEKIKVFPNPSDGSGFFVSAPAELNLSRYELKDISGRLIKKGQVNTDVIESELFPGIYFIKLISSKGDVFISKIVRN